MRLLVVQNHGQDGPGILGERLHARGATLDLVLPADGGVLPDSDRDHDAAIVLGGPQSAMDDAGFPHVPHLLGLLRAFAAADKPVLGICLGAQYMARAHAAPGNTRPVYPNHVVEVGFRPPVRFVREVASDPLLGHAPPELNLMHWHHDTLDLPPGAVRLAWSEHCAVQAYRLGRAQYGVQFHPEVTRDMVIDWITTHEGDIDTDHPGLRQRIGPELDAHIDAANAFCQALADRFLDLVRR